MFMFEKVCYLVINGILVLNVLNIYFPREFNIMIGN
jgi:hypothetical protein